MPASAAPDLRTASPPARWDPAPSISAATVAIGLRDQTLRRRRASHRRTASYRTVASEIVVNVQPGYEFAGVETADGPRSRWATAPHDVNARRLALRPIAHRHGCSVFRRNPAGAYDSVRYVRDHQRAPVASPTTTSARTSGARRVALSHDGGYVAVGRPHDSLVTTRPHVPPDGIAAYGGSSGQAATGAASIYSSSYSRGTWPRRPFGLARSRMRTLAAAAPIGAVLAFGEQRQARWRSRSLSIDSSPPASPAIASQHLESAAPAPSGSTDRC